jgi:diguanylate cyclase (GGDEF)-like protein
MPPSYDGRVSDWDEATATEMQALDESGPRPASVERRAYLMVITGGNVGSMFKLPTQDATIGRSQQAEVRLFDDGVSRNHARVRIEGDDLWVEDLASRNGTFVNGVRTTASTRLADGDKIQIGRTTVLKFSYQDALDESFHEQLLESALRDGLTKLFNKRYLLDRLDGELKFARRHHTALSVLMLDLDHFKKVNDEYGHLAGDAVLVAVAGILQRAVRNEDVVARFGGEEFAIVLRAIPTADAALLGERLRRLVEQATTRVAAADPGTTTIADEPPGRDLRVTVSIGVAGYPDVDAVELDALFQAADEALYRAKRDGRNRVAR